MNEPSIHDSNISHSAVNVTNLLEASELEIKSFNEVDYVAMLINPNIKMALKELPKSLIISNKIIATMRDLIIKDDTSIPDKIISSLYSKYPGTSLDIIKSKLDYYSSIDDREVLNHYLELLNNRVKKNVFDSSLNDYFQDKNLDKLINRIDVLNETVTSSIIPFIGLNTVTSSDITETFSDKYKLSSSLDMLNRNSHYKALLKGQLIAVAAPPGIGKTQFLINEAYHHAKNGYRVIYLAMGDSILSDFIIKLGCIHFNIRIGEFVLDIEKYINDPLFNSIIQRIDISIVSAGELKSGDVRKYYKSTKHLATADVYIFDYDSNFGDLASSTSLYSSGEMIYNNIYSLCRMADPKLVYIASQIKNEYANHQIIPLNGLAESGRKSQIIDYAVTISGLSDENMNCGIIHLSKCRRGRKGVIPYMLTKSGAILEIDKETYKHIRNTIKANALEFDLTK